MCKLTIVMPSYNRAEYMRKAIDSVLMQKTKYSYRLIIADDCSTDGSIDIINEYALKYPELISTRFNESNKGIYENTLQVFAAMDSEYFCVLDPDDYWICDTFVEQAIGYLDNHLDFVCYAANTIYVENGIETEKRYYHLKSSNVIINNIEEYFSKLSVIPHTTGGIYRNVVYKNGIPTFLQNMEDDLSKQSFRADTGRFMMHLKYGK